MTDQMSDERHARRLETAQVVEATVEVNNIAVVTEIKRLDRIDAAILSLSAFESGLPW